MTQTTNAKPVQMPASGRVPRRWMRAAAAVTGLAAVITVGMSALASEGDAAASATVLRAAEQTAKAHTFRATSVGIDEQGKKLISTVDDKSESASLANSTEHMLRAALSDRGATEKGRQDVRGVSTVHYRVSLSEKAQAELAGLAPKERAWFGLETTSIFYTLDVFLADGLIRRIELHGRYFTTVDFYDFGGTGSN